MSTEHKTNFSELAEDMHNTALHALQQWGPRAQAIKACEEMGELITALSKRLNMSPIINESIIDEIADVFIVTMQMRNIYGAAAVDARIRYKLDRLKKKLLTYKDAETGNTV